MLRYEIVAISGAFIVLTGCANAPARTEDATAEIKPLMEKMAVAWATLDPSKVAQYYAKEVGLAFYDIAPLKYTGWQEYQDGTQRAFADWKSMTWTIGPDLKAYKNGNIAWVTFTSTYEITPKTGDLIKLAGRTTEVLEKRGQDWVIVHDHESVPMPEAPPPPAKK